MVTMEIENTCREGYPTLGCEHLCLEASSKPLLPFESTLNDSTSSIGNRVLQLALESLSAEALMEWADVRFAGNLLVTTSFGIQSAVTLHLASRVRPNIPVVWIDTGYLPAETYRYAETLTDRLNLNLHIYQSDLSPARMEAKYGRLWESSQVDDLNEYDRIRKVEPLNRALRDLEPTGWISGLRREQTSHRQNLPRVRFDGERHRILPILSWSSKDAYEYMVAHQLPQHPLWHEGYSTVGDWHNSRALVATDTDERDTRFNGLKQECGIHL